MIDMRDDGDVANVLAMLHCGKASLFCSHAPLWSIVLMRKF
jgi:hypothetical protein